MVDIIDFILRRMVWIIFACIAGTMLVAMYWTDSKASPVGGEEKGDDSDIGRVTCHVVSFWSSRSPTIADRPRQCEPSCGCRLGLDMGLPRLAHRVLRGFALHRDVCLQEA